MELEYDSAISSSSSTSSAARSGTGTTDSLERGGSGGGGGGEGHGVRTGDIVRVAEQPRGAERKGEKRGMEMRGVEGVVVKVGGRGGGTVLQVALGGEEDDLEGLGARVWV